MSDETSEGEPRIQVDADWKTEAAREKEKLADETAEEGKAGALPEPKFAELIQMIAMQAMVGLGGMASPDGRQIPPDLDMAKHQIDMLELVAVKTAGNLDAEEKELLDAVLHDVRMRFVQAVGGGSGGAVPKVEPPRG